MSGRLVEADRAMLEGLSERETQIADAATRLAYERAGDWLTDKQTKSEQFGGNLDHAAAYRNAAQEMYCWAVGHGIT